MKRFLTILAAAATLSGATAPTAFAQTQDAEVTMLTGKVFRALRDCGLDGNMVDELTMAQVAGISIAASSDEATEKCQTIESIARGDG